MQSETQMRPLDLSNLLRHAFISGFQSMGGTITAACGCWPQYDPETCSSYHRVTAALSDKQAVEVKIKPLEWIEHPSADAWRADTMLGTYQVWAGSLKTGWLFDGLFAERLNETSHDEDAAKAAAQADYERRIRSALVDVPAVEPVAKRWLVEETLPSGAIKWEVVEHENHARKIAAMCRNATVTPLYTSPPLSREGKDSAEVERLRGLLDVALDVLDNYADPTGYTDSDGEQVPSDADVHQGLLAKETAFNLRAALAAARSGSATTHSGGDHGR